MRLILLLPFLAAVSTTQADTLSALQSRLGALQGPATLTAEMTYFQLPLPNKPLPPGHQPVTLQVREDAEGLRTLWSENLLQRFSEELRREVNDADPARVVAQGMDEIHAGQVWKYFHAANEIERTLVHARLTSEEDTVFEGHPARLLSFAVTPLLNEKSKGYIKELEVTFKLWVSADFTPLAAESKSHVRGRALLVISFQSNDAEQFRFATIQNRLVVTRHQKDGSSSGGGESNSYNQETVLKFPDLLANGGVVASGAQ